jgi:hypothetical protein
MGEPHTYADELDFRIILLTYNRPESLRKCLARIAEVKTLGDHVGVDIWIDRSRDGKFDQATFDVADEFTRTWQHGVAYVHVQPKHAYIIGQWVNTWHPRENSRELALILEDDIDISPFLWQWLKATHSHFKSWPDVAGYTTQMENVNFVQTGSYRPAAGPKTDTVFLYQLIGTWGYAPKPDHWRDFQDWFHKVWKDPDFRPYIPDTVLDSWYRKFEKQGRRFSMWEMYLIYYNHEHKLYTVYSNLLEFTGKKDVLLDSNRREIGLHATRDSYKDNSENLLCSWDSSYVQFPDHIVRYEFDTSSDLTGQS